MGRYFPSTIYVGSADWRLICDGVESWVNQWRSRSLLAYYEICLIRTLNLAGKFAIIDYFYGIVLELDDRFLQKVL
jgi:hypothetical protein